MTGVSPARHARGVPLGTIQVFVGHISTRMLLHYTHIASKAVEMLNAEPMLTPTLAAPPSSDVDGSNPLRKDMIH
jgi:hypothetical protein